MHSSQFCRLCFFLYLFTFSPPLHKPQTETHACTLQHILRRVPEMLPLCSASHLSMEKGALREGCPPRQVPTGDVPPERCSPKRGAHQRRVLSARVSNPGRGICVGACLQPGSGGQSWALAVSIPTSLSLTAVNWAESTKS